MWLLAPVATAAVALAIGLSLEAWGGTESDLDLQLVAPAAAPPGRPIGMRAFVVSGASLVSPGRHEAATVHVTLRDARGAVIVRSALPPAATEGSAGALALPEGRSGTFHLEAHVERDGRVAASVRSVLRVAADASPLPARPRQVPPLQTFREVLLHRSRSRVPDGWPRPHGLEGLFVRQPMGACVPEVSCELLVWIGVRPAAVHLVDEGGAEPVDAEASPHTEEIVSRRVLVRGPEAQVRVVAISDGEYLAERSVRLAVVPGMPVVRPVKVLLRTGETALARIEGERPERAYDVDVFEDGHWVLAATVTADADGTLRLPAPPGGLRPALWRWQLRDRPTATETQAVVLAHVRPPHASEHDAVDALARALLETAPDEPVARAWLDRTFRAEPELAARMLLSWDAFDVIPLPPAHSELLDRLGRRREHAGVGRRIAAGVIVGSGLVAGAMVWWRGRLADRRARALRERAGDATTDARTGRAIAPTLVLVLLVLLVVASFAVVGGWVLLR